MRRYFTVISVGALLAGVVAAQPVPKIETFLGYTYVHFYSSNDVTAFNGTTFNTFNVPSFSANGGRAEFVYNVNRHAGLVLNVGGVTNSNFAGFNIDNTQAFFMAGPRYTFHRGRIKPYAQAVFGGVYYTASTPVEVAALGPIGILPVAPVTARLNTNQTKFALAAGIGLDIQVTRHMSFRPGSVDYYYTRISDLRAPGDNSQNNIMYSAGLNFMFGGEKPAPPQPPKPQTKTCPDGTVVDINAACPKLNTSLALTAQPPELCPGEKSQVTVTSNNNADFNMMKFMWSVNGQPASQDRSFTFVGDQPGTFTIQLNATGDKFNPASAQTSIVVHPYQPPTGTVSANPPEIPAGDKSSLSSNFTGQCGGPIQPATYTASEGTVVGDQFDSSSLQWDTSNNAEQRKTITITAKAADNKTEGTATTTIEVIKKATAAPVRLPDILFSRNSARVNNCGKRVLLDQLRSYYERDSSGQVVIVGHQSADEKAGDLSDQRAMNAAAVVTAGTGVCLAIPQSQVQISAPGTDQQGVDFDSSFCASSVPAGPSANERRVVVWFVPNGAAIPSSVTNAKPASATTVGSLGCPK